jgi:hypothetical protein
MASTDLVSTGGFITYQGSGFQLLDDTIVETLNQSTLMQNYKDYSSKLDVTQEKLLNPNQTFTAKAPPKSMDDVLETGVAKTAEQIFTPKKGVTQVLVANKYERSDYFTEWAKVAKNIEGSPDAIQAELALSGSEVLDLTTAYDQRWAEHLIKVYTNGFSGGGGTLTPKGKNLFDTHTYGVTGSLVSGTFTNFTNGALTFTSSAADILAGTTRLQTLINQLKSAKYENGRLVPQVGPYRLYCSRVNSVFWKQVLNDNSQFSGQGSNANQENQFNFKGNIVELVVLDLLGTPDYNGNLIGTANYIFVTNSGSLKAAKAFKSFMLKPLTIESWKNMDTKVYNTEGRAIFGADHYGLELYVAGSTCA